MIWKGNGILDFDLAVQNDKLEISRFLDPFSNLSKVAEDLEKDLEIFSDFF